MGARVKNDIAATDGAAAYKRHARMIGERTREISRAGRDIGDIPPVDVTHEGIDAIRESRRADDEAEDDHGDQSEG